jgi:hypothetical protein
MIVIDTPEVLDHLYAEVEFPENIGEHRLTAGVIHTRDEPKGVTQPIAIHPPCHFVSEQDTLPPNINETVRGRVTTLTGASSTKTVTTSSSKVTIEATYLEDAIVGDYGIPAPVAKDPITGIHEFGEFTYQRWGYSLRSQLNFRITQRWK